jgi:hypothetical protein
MKKSLIALGAAALAFTSLTACSSGGETETAPVACEELPADEVAEFNYVFEAYENGESITSGAITPVQMEGAGTLPYVALIAAKLNKAGTVALWAQGEGGFIVPLNEAAISAMPDAAAEGDVSQWLNSSEGQATIACVQ